MFRSTDGEHPACVDYLLNKGLPLEQDIERIISENSFKIDMVKAEILRSNSEAGTLSADRIYSILSGEFSKKKKSSKPAPVKIKSKIISRFFSLEQKTSEIEEVIEKASGYSELMRGFEGRV